MAGQSIIESREMLRDFWDHWMWETRIAVFEAEHPQVTNPELTDQLVKYVAKYGKQAGSGTHHLSSVKGGSAGHEVALGRWLRYKHGSKLATMEALAPLIDEVLPAAPDSKPPTWAYIPATKNRRGEGYDLRAIADFFSSLTNAIRGRPEGKRYAAMLENLQPALREALDCLKSGMLIVDEYTPDDLARLVRRLDDAEQ